MWTTLWINPVYSKRPAFADLIESRPLEFPAKSRWVGSIWPPREPILSPSLYKII